MVRLLLLAAVALTSLTRYAEAGACLGDDEIDDGIALLERSIKKPAKELDYYAICLPTAIEHQEDGNRAGDGDRARQVA